MRILRQFHVCLFLLACSLPSITAWASEPADASSGSLDGIAWRPDGTPSLGATVLVRQVGAAPGSDGSQFLSTDITGHFAASGLPAGAYELRAAGAAGVSEPVNVTVPAGGDAHVELALQQTTERTPNAATPPANVPQRGFWTRLGHAYLDDWSPPVSDATPAPAPQRRGTPAPLNSPPFPSADWPIGGTVVIGAPDYQTYPLMTAIEKPNARIKMYGWFDIGGNASTSDKGLYANNETAYDVIPNSFQLDQAVLYFERLPNTVQTDHMDWGFRLASLYGLDYRYTTALGVFSQQLLSHASGQQYGFDEVMYYLDVYLPHIAKGADLRIGRYISLPDIEAQLAPNNYTYSHSILYTYDCYTQHGIVLTTKLSEHWTVQGGVSGGCEIAPWVTGTKLTGTATVAYSWHNGADNLYFAANSLNSAKYGYNNISGYYLTYYHKINETWHTDTEGWYQYERDVPNNNYTAGPVISPAPIKGANGAYCTPTAMHCYAPDYAIVNYIEHEFNNHHSSFTIRNEVFNDIKGQRTGTPTVYSEHLFGFNFWVGSTITFRPEARFEHAYNQAAYDSPYLGSPTKKSQGTLAGDLIYHF